MSIKLSRLVGAAAMAVTLTAASASAQSYVFSLSTGVQPSNVGTITITQVNATTVNVFADLISNTYGFLETGGPHTPFAFTLGGANPEVGVSAVFLTPLNGAYAAGTFSLSTTDGDATPFGTFGISINTTAGNGSGNAYYGDLNFNVVRTGGLTIDNFIANASGYYFAADITNGNNTGSQAWGGRCVTDCGGGGQSVVPEPSTYLLMATGLAGLGFFARRRRRNTSV